MVCDAVSYVAQNERTCHMRNRSQDSLLCNLAQPWKECQPDCVVLPDTSVDFLPRDVPRVYQENSYLGSHLAILAVKWLFYWTKDTFSRYPRIINRNCGVKSVKRFLPVSKMAVKKSITVQKVLKAWSFRANQGYSLNF